ncbi:MULTISPECIES: type II secretion system protein GspG [Flavobacterium]|uniref:Type II secretion system protein GspG n=1 Tax=Flavobacterium jumunjinense TaxID=998845 RepID=A0ABV5GQL7_9FLAO|nr:MULTISPECIES: type II secretion system protein GspG [Flavobacterium]
MLDIIIDFLLHYLHFDFLKEKKKRREFERANSLPKKTMIHPNVKIYGILLLILSSIFCLIGFYRYNYSNKNDTLDEISKIETLLEKNKEAFGIYPEKLSDIIRNNPLRKDITIDLWGNEYHYEVENNRTKYIIISKGKDGVLNTNDDIKIK